MRFFTKPQNAGTIENPDGYGYFEDTVNTNVIEVFLKVKDTKIQDIKFRTFGCVAAIASSAAVTKMAEGKTLKDAQKISDADVLSELGGLPAVKKHCSVLAVNGLRSAIQNCREKI
jgi:nitrogen fixation NifU-like protein